MLIHFNDMKQDLPGSIRAIAKFLDITVDEQPSRRSSSIAASTT
jgi:hypothetical protein